MTRRISWVKNGLLLTAAWLAPNRAQEDTVCNVQVFNGAVTRVFKPLEIACPDIGERVAVSFDFLFPDNGSETSSTDISIAVSHGSNGNFDQTSGLIATADNFVIDDCPFAPVTAIDIDSAWGATTENLACKGGLSRKTKLCSAFTYQGTPGKTASFGIVFFNTGSCDGTVQVEANLVDSTPETETAYSPCLSPLRPRCDASFAPTPEMQASSAPELSETPEPIEAPDFTEAPIRAPVSEERAEDSSAVNPTFQEMLFRWSLVFAALLIV